MSAEYTEDSIRSLDWKEHIRLRPGMYIGKLGDGSSQDDGIYVLIKEIIDNAIDEFVNEHSLADRQKLRNLQRQANREHELKKPPVASRKLFTYIRSLAE